MSVYKLSDQDVEKLQRVVTRSLRDDQMVVAIPVAMLDQLLSAYRLLMAAEKHGAKYGPGLYGGVD